MTVYAHINTVPNGSTGGIMLREHSKLLAAGYDSHAFWGRGRAATDATEWRFAFNAEVRVDALQTRIDGRADFHSKAATRRLLARLDEIKPNVVHLHNLHGYYVNVEVLFEWLAAHEDVRVEWTLHDCWAFTGHCAYFDKCPLLRIYSKTYLLSSCKRKSEDKKRLFNLVPPERMGIIASSRRLVDLVSKPFLADYPMEVRHNAVETSLFCPMPNDFRERYGIGDRFMVLHVADPWTERKGLGDFMDLVGKLAERYSIACVGLSKRQNRELPKRIAAIERTEGPQQLAAIYPVADVFFSPMSGDNCPTFNLEGEACGMPVVAHGIGRCAEIFFLAGPSFSAATATISPCGLSARCARRGVQEHLEFLFAQYGHAVLARAA